MLFPPSQLVEFGRIATTTDLDPHECNAFLPPRDGRDPQPPQNHPLKLWYEDDPVWQSGNSGCLQRIDGELHFLPPPAERGVLAFFWLFLQATTPASVDPPTVAQLRNLPRIVALARGMPLAKAEKTVQCALKNLLKQSATPPLPCYDDPNILTDALAWYDRLGSACAEL